jgi:diguanylate cyclase (GGDEF)-like protein
VCWIDIDDFKVINDTYGHAAGDELLRRFSARVREMLRTEDTLARLCGDEFGVLLEGARCASAAAQRVLDAAEDPFSVAGTSVRVPVSIGVTVLAPQDGYVAAEEFMSRADIAMYAAKARGKNCFETYSPGVTMPGSFDVVLRDPLRAAIAGRRIEVQYQPVYWIQTGKLRGFEALARWSYQGNPISPERFVALASLKLDRSFLADIDTDPRAQPFLRAVVRLAKELGLRVIGEGVERDCQLDVLRRLGCQLVQGYLLSPPRPPAAFDELVADPAAACESLPEAVPAPRERRESSAGAEVQA